MVYADCTPVKDTDHDDKKRGVPMVGMEESAGLWQIGEAASRAGVSVRTLRYYDRIGLLAPCQVTAAGYRLYDEAALLRLGQILFFRELGFPLEEIRRMMSNPAYDAREAMRRQHTLLCMRRARLDETIARLERVLDGDVRMQEEELRMTDIETVKRQYADEARARWGSTPAYAEGRKRESAYTGADWQRIQAEMEALLREFAMHRDEQPQAQMQLVKRWQAHITRWHYDCTDAILLDLGRMYAQDDRFAQNIDRYGVGTAQFMRDAIEAYVRARTSGLTEKT